MLTENAASYTPDFASEIDTEEEIIADQIGITIEQARMVIAMVKDASRRDQATTLANIIGHLLNGSNIQAKVHALAIAFGLDTLNGFHSQAEIAREIGCTRALISHYVVAWRDVLAGEVPAFDCLKFRKHNETRKTYAKMAASKTLTAKRKRHDHEHH